MPRLAPRPAHRLAALPLLLALTGGLVVPSAAGADEVPVPPVGVATDPAEQAEQALETAEEALTGTPPTAPGEEAADPSLALLDLALAVDDLDGSDRERAEDILARPTDGADDELGGGYREDARIERRCDDHVCLHRATNTADRATTQYADRALEVMGQVWTHHVDEMGFRAPVPDAGTPRKGGDTRFDVYLADLGEGGLYGYCTPEDAEGAQDRVRPSYCVLDNDYDPSQYDGRSTPDEALRVSAAHEFLHAVQYAYDADEDVWFLESTATWIEERFADDVDDNRQFLRDGQVVRPRSPLDRYPGYGSWAFVEHLTTRFDDDLVRETWERAAAPATAAGGGLASWPALVATLRARGADPRQVYARFAADNLAPWRSPYYPEGGQWGLRAPAAERVELSPSRRGTTFAARPLHLSSTTLALRPRDLGPRNRLQLRIDGPSSAAQPAAYVLSRRTDGTLGRRYVPLTGPGGTATVRTDVASRRVREVTVTLVNVSPRRSDDRRPFTVEARAVR